MPFLIGLITGPVIPLITADLISYAYSIVLLLSVPQIHYSLIKEWVLYSVLDLIGEGYKLRTG